MLFMFGTLFSNVFYAQHFIVDDKYQKEAMLKVIRKADNGDPESMYLTAKHYLNGGIVEKDEVLGMKYLLLACDKGYARAWEDRADMTNNKEEALEYYRKSIELYNEQDLVRTNKDAVLDLIYTYGQYFDNIDKDKSISQYLFAAKYGHESSMIMCALYYWKNENTYNKTYDYFIKLSAKENTIGDWGLGEMYYSGQYVNKDIHKAILYYEKAANDGDYLSQQRLAEIYYDGESITQDFNKAYKYCHLAACNVDKENDSGTGDIMHRLAACYRFGRGVNKNEKLAELWDIMATWYASIEGESLCDVIYDTNVDDESEYLKLVLKKFYPEICRDNNVSSKIVCALYQMIVMNNNEGVASLVNVFRDLENANIDKFFLGTFLVKILERGNTSSVIFKEINEFVKKNNATTDIDINEGMSRWFDNVFVKCVVSVENKYGIIM